MKLKLSQLLAAREPLKRLSAAIFTAQIAYRISRNLRNVEAETKIYDTTREALIREKYGVPVADREGAYRVPPDKVKDFAAELEPLLNEEIEVEIVKLALGDIATITPNDLMAMEWMFDVPAEPPQKKRKRK